MEICLKPEINIFQNSVHINLLFIFYSSRSSSRQSPKRDFNSKNNEKAKKKKKRKSKKKRHKSPKKKRKTVGSEYVELNLLTIKGILFLEAHLSG